MWGSARDLRRVRIGAGRQRKSGAMGAEVCCSGETGDDDETPGDWNRLHVAPVRSKEEVRTEGKDEERRSRRE